MHSAVALHASLAAREATLGLEAAGDDVEEGRLPGARRAQQARQLPGTNPA